MINVLIAITPLFLVIFIGAFLEHAKIADKNWSPVLNNFALKIGLPALIFASLAKMDFVFSEQSQLIYVNSLVMICSFLIALVIGKILRLNRKNFRTFFICLGFTNCAYLGFPTLTQIYGESVLPIASLIVAVYLFWIFTLGIGFLDYTQIRSHKNLAKKILLNLIKNPLLIAVFLGLIVASLGINIPVIINKSIDMLSASVTPVVLIVIGLFIGQSKFGNIKKWIPVFIFSIMTLMVIPGLFILGIKLFGLNLPEFTTSIVISAMPLAITPFALADTYKLNKGFIARSIVLSTILAIITIPFWSSIA
ncbi:AEC family transporter [Candidatus Peregrinibacteria bacterium]|nr:AEC family transporter [Candidatus Peregrinibacteria bacterium]